MAQLTEIIKERSLIKSLMTLPIRACFTLMHQMLTRMRRIIKKIKGLTTIRLVVSRLQPQDIADRKIMAHQSLVSHLSQLLALLS